MTKFLHRIAAILAVVAVSAVMLSPPGAAAVALSAPEPLRVDSVTATQIAFHWSQNTSGSVGILRARVYQNGALVTTTRLQRYTASGLVPGATYSFHVIAADDGGNTSPPSRTITITTRGPGVVPPGPANLRATEVAAARVGLAFEQPDDSWDIGHYEILDGATVVATIGAGAFSGIPTINLALRGLAPQSSHSYVARAVRGAIGVSPSSNTLTLSTLPRTDLAAPSAPTGLVAKVDRYACFSVVLTWTQSSDNADPQSAVDYEILVNGTHEGWVRGVGTHLIGIVPVGNNTIAVRAVDSSGNTSASAITTFLRPPDCGDDA
ncbi:fibronectin type III domain-containing protein [Nonomuraea endophytica]|uniref:Putative phage tail protein n=1 Tax=Nonomuraea endophytica TaxID=714136 RepID=A0A7W7ZWC8_9ACTN|nr:fibronectin type III domain-containing protein [Nonomuraea endophytica]MBB5075015.1 putative phage tail protein [Nonomuraea endophytica]